MIETKSISITHVARASLICLRVANSNLAESEAPPCRIFGLSSPIVLITLSRKLSFSMDPYGSRISSRISDADVFTAESFFLAGLGPPPPI